MTLSVARVLAVMAITEWDETPVEAAARWCRYNGRSAGEVFPVPGMDVMACQVDSRCSEPFASAPSIDNLSGRIEMEDEQ